LLLIAWQKLTMANYSLNNAKLRALFMMMAVCAQQALMNPKALDFGQFLVRLLVMPIQQTYL
jgi:hypothetical protein